MSALSAMRFFASIAKRRAAVVRAARSRSALVAIAVATLAGCTGGEEPDPSPSHAAIGCRWDEVSGSYTSAYDPGQECKWNGEMWYSTHREEIP